MTLLIISPDYASHLYPLATLGAAWQQAGERVVVASGPATADIVAAFGFERENLQLGRGSNPGTIRVEAQPAGEDDALRGFFDATRRGMVDTLRFQAEARSSDLLWNPVEIARNVQALVRRVQPDHVIVDHLAFSARLGLMTAGVHHADVVLGHPSALPVFGEVYGYPPDWSDVFRPGVTELAGLRVLCESVRDSFTAQWNAALAELNPGAVPSTDAFQETGDVLLLNYPEELHSAERTALLPEHVFLGSAVRSEAPDSDVEAWLAASEEPIVYVSFGSFLSVRGDVLERVAAALTGLGVRVALATGATEPATLGPIPDSWLVRGFLPQVRLLDHAVLAVSHGGNNSVTEAMTAGVPLLVLPFSTDQFAGAAALDRAGFAETLDPNTATSAQIRAAAVRLLALAGAPRDRLERLGQSLSHGTGPRRAREALTAASVVC
ncbi:glycosyltransferase [Cryobacterium sp. MLB-32]|uniref:nucleotide disphospho-sugar-binding domain-containing protein n=1 Tax=Cryobacterium sp. MLB-32 TaxID=1529318 RepID=UPI0004E62307|nr:nucleotide disphospho-sugar-binding domain-containing protein [Cryobacterium sp. MLB-32]KFF61002.1 glycosyltransferase [Cryobacterium sp. MLB-32]